MKTAIVNLSAEELKSRLRKFSLESLISDAKTHPVKTMPGHTAVQHPRLAAMSEEELFDICTLARIPLVRVVDCDKLP